MIVFDQRRWEAAAALKSRKRAGILALRALFCINFDTYYWPFFLGGPSLAGRDREGAKIVLTQEEQEKLEGRADKYTRTKSRGSVRLIRGTNRVCYVRDISRDNRRIVRSSFRGCHVQACFAAGYGELVGFPTRRNFGSANCPCKEPAREELRMALDPI
jgi:hypothetical protein